jgi:hypothetical protein
MTDSSWSTQTGQAGTQKTRIRSLARTHMGWKYGMGHPTTDDRLALGEHMHGTNSGHTVQHVQVKTH